MSHFNYSLTRRLTVTRYVKGPRFINERHRKGVPYFVKNVLQRVTAWVGPRDDEKPTWSPTRELFISPRVKTVGLDHYHISDSTYILVTYFLG